jgi:hypothetical protein
MGSLDSITFLGGYLWEITHSLCFRPNKEEIHSGVRNAADSI